MSTFDDFVRNLECNQRRRRREEEKKHSWTCKHQNNKHLYVICLIVMNLSTELLEGVKGESSFSIFTLLFFDSQRSKIVRTILLHFLGITDIFPVLLLVNFVISFSFYFTFFYLGQLIVKIPFLDIANTFPGVFC